MKVAVYTIALNEERHVERWYESSRNADYHFILDTGSIDKTASIARKLGIKVAKAHVHPWRFDAARNTALALLPADVDYCVSLDMDEVLVGDWRAELERALAAGATRPRHTFTFSFNPDGSPGMQFSASRIHARNGYTWRYPIHEVVGAYGGSPDVQFETMIEMQHHPDRAKPREQYLDLLTEAVKENPADSRLSFYYGRELMYRSQHEKATTELLRFLELPGATWRAERSDAMHYLAMCSGNDEDKAGWLMAAISEAPDRREGYVELARLHYFQGQYELALLYSDQALAITERPLEYMCEESSWNWEPWDIAAVCAWQTGDRDKALRYGKKALELNPSDGRLQTNLLFYSGQATEEPTA